MIDELKQMVELHKHREWLQKISLLDQIQIYLTNFKSADNAAG